MCHIHRLDTIHLHEKTSQSCPETDGAQFKLGTHAIAEASASNYTVRTKYLKPENSNLFFCVRLDAFCSFDTDT